MKKLTQKVGEWISKVGNSFSEIGLTGLEKYRYKLRRSAKVRRRCDHISEYFASYDLFVAGPSDQWSRRRVLHNVNPWYFYKKDENNRAVRVYPHKEIKQLFFSGEFLALVRPEGYFMFSEAERKKGIRMHEPIRFSEEGVQIMNEDVVIPLSREKYLQEYYPKSYEEFKVGQFRKSLNFSASSATKPLEEKKSEKQELSPAEWEFKKEELWGKEKK